jgi:pimeloyl-ACP methyl ester carboxylesterase
MRPLIAKCYWAGAPFHFRTPPRDAAAEPLMLRAADGRELSALYWTPAARRSPRVAAVCIHPRVDFTRHYCIPRLLAAGIGCLAANTRHPNNDIDSVHEELVLDVAACVSFLRHEGAERVVLIGNSGGGSLCGLFQAEAERAPADRLTHTPAGAPTRFAEFDLLPADGVVFLAAHLGQGRVLGECIDAAVVDESDPLATDPALDMYHPDNGFAAPPAWTRYDDDFVARYRAAQDARITRLDACARDALLASDRAAARIDDDDFAALPPGDQTRLWREKLLEPLLVIYRTMADPSYVDDHLDPSPRDYGSLLSDRPDLMNMRHLGFARVCTPRAWLSTWSRSASNADLLRNAPAIRVPTLVVSAGKDREIHPRAHTLPLVAALGASDRRHVDIAGAGHYFEPDDPRDRHAPHVEAAMDAVVGWIVERFAP